MITCEEVRQLFEYNDQTGQLLRSGRPVGTPHSLGYLKVKIRGRTYFVHRLVFLYCYGRWPIRLDHINRDKTDNKLSNLRECSHEHNNANRGMMRNNTSGFKGVHFHRSSGYWKAQVGYEVVGYYKTKKEAAVAYDQFAILRYGSSAVTNAELGLL